MSEPLDPQALQVGRSSRFGARPQPLNSVMNPWDTTCPSCQHPLIEKNCNEHGSGGDYVYFEGFDPAGYYHRSCLTRLLAEYTKNITEQAVADQE